MENIVLLGSLLIFFVVVIWITVKSRNANQVVVYADILAVALWILYLFGIHSAGSSVSIYQAMYFLVVIIISSLLLMFALYGLKLFIKKGLSYESDI